MATAPYNQMTPFEYVVLYHPTPAEREKGEEFQSTKLVTDGVQLVMAKDEKHASLLAARAIPESYSDNLDRCEILLREFAPFE